MMLLSLPLAEKERLPLSATPASSLHAVRPPLSISLASASAHDAGPTLSGSLHTVTLSPLAATLRKNTGGPLGGCHASTSCCWNASYLISLFASQHWTEERTGAAGYQ